jgi:hypothetical protein
MNPQINSALDAIRSFLESSEDLAAWGPDLAGVVDGSHLQGEPGTLGAVNISDAQDALDMYLGDIAVRLQAENEGMSDDDAFDHIFAVAAEMADEGQLDPLPEEDAPDQEVTAWLGQAASVLFGGQVIHAARE